MFQIRSSEIYKGGKKRFCSAARLERWWVGKGRFMASTFMLFTHIRFLYSSEFRLVITQGFWIDKSQFFFFLFGSNFSIHDSFYSLRFLKQMYIYHIAYLHSFILYLSTIIKSKQISNISLLDGEWLMFAPKKCKHRLTNTLLKFSKKGCIPGC